MNNESHVHSAPSFYTENAPDLGQLFPATLVPSRFPHWAGADTAPVLARACSCVSICRCICSQGSGRRSGSRRTAGVSGSLPAPRWPRWHRGHRRGRGRSAAGKCQSSPAQEAGISPSGALAKALDTPWQGCASPWWSHRTQMETGSPQSGSWIYLYTPAGHRSAGSLLGTSKPVGNIVVNSWTVTDYLHLCVNTGFATT